MSSFNNSPQKPFDHTHYLPVLRCKEAEKDALAQLRTPVRTNMTPLIEIPRKLSIKSEELDDRGKKKRIYLERHDPRVPQQLDLMLQKTTADIKAVWLKRALFLDLQHLIFP